MSIPNAHGELQIIRCFVTHVNKLMPLQAETPYALMVLPPLSKYKYLQMRREEQNSSTEKLFSVQHTVTPSTVISHVR